MRIKANLRQIKKFIKIITETRGYSHRIKRKTYDEIIKILEITLLTQIFKSHNETWHIPNHKTLERRISSGDEHPDGEDYSQEYLDRKEISGGVFKPHAFREYRFWRNIRIKESFAVDGVVVEIEDYKKPVRGLDVIKHHESKRSVLRATYLLSWKSILKTILTTYAKEIKKL